MLYNLIVIINSILLYDIKNSKNNNHKCVHI